MNFWLILIVFAQVLKGVGVESAHELKPTPVFFYPFFSVEELKKADPIGCFTQERHKSPQKAMLLSLLPGGGQFYTENYLKGGVFLVVQTALASATIYEYILKNRAKKRGDQYAYEHFSNWLSNFIWISGTVWVIAIADAYVSAHFYNFKEQGTLEIGVNF